MIYVLQYSTCDVVRVYGRNGVFLYIEIIHMCWAKDKSIVAMTVYTS